jgi:hypothetical protein
MSAMRSGSKGGPDKKFKTRSKDHLGNNSTFFGLSKQKLFKR